MKKILIIISIMSLFMLSACNTDSDQTDDVETPNETTTEDTNTPEIVDTSGITAVTELVIEDVVIGDGAEAKSGDTIKAHYKGYILDGTVFDSSYDRDEAAIFPIGIGYLIQGWEQGIPGMKVGGTRKLIIPGDLGYGPEGNPSAGIPANATLIFEIELLEIM